MPKLNFVTIAYYVCLKLNSLFSNKLITEKMTLKITFLAILLHLRCICVLPMLDKNKYSSSLFKHVSTVHIAIIAFEMEAWVSGYSTWLATLATLFLLYRLLSHHLSSRRRLNLPPGPKPWPIIGNLNLIGSLPHRSFHTLSQKYGPIMHFSFGSVPVVVGSSVQMAEAFLKTHDAIFASRPKMC